LTSGLLKAATDAKAAVEVKSADNAEAAAEA
jgi:hypothetical protein